MPNQLDAYQLAAITTKSTNAAVLATAGSGKTRVVIHRIAHLVTERRVDPARILAVTFSKKAATEMQRRLEELLGSTKARIGTLHSLAYDIVRKEDDHSWQVGDEVVQEYERQVRYQARRSRLDPTLTLDALSWMKNVGCSPSVAGERFLPPNLISRFTALVISVEDWRLNEDILTYDDMLVRANELLEREAIRETWMRQYDHVIVDEHQDTNPVQQRIISYIAGSNVMYVGDSMQSIYGFRGASGLNIKATHELLLNYRSAQAIVALGDKVAKRHTKAFRPERGMVSFKPYADDNREATGVALAILEGQSKTPFTDIAVLYRKNAQSGPLEAALAHHKIPFTLAGPSFFTAPEVAGLLGYLWLAAGRGTKNDVARSLNTPIRWVKRDVAHAIYEADGTDWVQRARYADGNANSIEWGRLIDDLVLLVENGESPVALLRTVIDRTHLIDRLTSDEGRGQERDPVANVNTLLTRAGAFEHLDDFLDEVDEVVTKSKSRKPGVTLSTIHRAKGLEWKTVYLVGAHEGVLPLKGAELEEERRLTYVAATRAMDELVVSHSGEELNRWLT